MSFTLQSNKKVKMHPKGPDFINKIELKFEKMQSMSNICYILYTILKIVSMLE